MQYHYIFFLRFSLSYKVDICKYIDIKHNHWTPLNKEVIDSYIFVVDQSSILPWPFTKSRGYVGHILDFASKVEAKVILALFIPSFILLFVSDLSLYVIINNIPLWQKMNTACSQHVPKLIFFLLTLNRNDNPFQTSKYKSKFITCKDEKIYH